MPASALPEATMVCDSMACLVSTIFGWRSSHRPRVVRASLPEVPMELIFGSAVVMVLHCLRSSGLLMDSLLAAGIITTSSKVPSCRGLSALSAEKKTALAEIGTRARAKIAELEILFAKTLEKARDSKDPEKIAKVEEEHREAIARIRNREEDDRRKVRET